MNNAGFNQMSYRDRPLKILRIETKGIIIMQRNHPDRLDMRYARNKDYVRTLANVKALSGIPNFFMGSMPERRTGKLTPVPQMPKDFVGFTDKDGNIIEAEET